MLNEQITLNNLFEQFGLDGSDEAISQFIEQNQLPQEVKLVDATFWSENQRKFIKEEYVKDAVWVEVLDDLNTRLHKNAMNAANEAKR